MKKIILAGITTVAIAAFMRAASADNITVGNFSFEDPATSSYTEPTSILDWSLSANSGGGGGISNFSAASDASVGTADGSNFAFENVDGAAQFITYTGTGTPTGSGTGTDTAIALPTIQSGYNYTLTVALDNRNGADSDGVLDLNLTAGGFTFTNTVAETDLTDTFTDKSVTLTAAEVSADGLVGQTLGIQLEGAASTDFYQADFDNVRLTDTAVPEPRTWALMAFGGLLFLAGLGRMKRQV